MRKSESVSRDPRQADEDGEGNGTAAIRVSVECGGGAEDGRSDVAGQDAPRSEIEICC